MTRATAGRVPSAPSGTVPEVWAPRAREVHLVLDADRVPMHPLGDGWFRAPGPLADGTRYRCSLDGGAPLPDPRSHHQPDGVHGPSAAVDHDAFAWTDRAWRGFQLPGSVLYELHVGTFTPAGTFDAAIGHLDHLVALGVDAIELMPVAAFAGERGWGYDGVFWFAPHRAYGGPAAMKRFVDAAHAAGIAVLLDVVFNHFGPEGNVTASFGPYVHDAHTTPWGPAVNLDGGLAGPVRHTVVACALHWLERYHLDGLRLDAVHALVDDSAVHVLEELRAAVDVHAARLRRTLWLVAENDTNDPRLVTPSEAGGTGLDAVWADDLHHALHTVLTGEAQGYYAPFGRPSHLAKAMEDVYVHDGGWVPELGRRRGRPVGEVDRRRFVVAAQNHDQIGNRARGDRLGHLVHPDLVPVAAALTLLSPGTPLLFMGEEWAASTPFTFFCDFPDEQLAQAVRDGRRSEFAAFGWAPEDVPDPLDPATAAASVLRWDERHADGHDTVLEWYRWLLGLRRRHPAFVDGRAGATRARAQDDERWIVVDRGPFTIAANLSSEPRCVPARAGLDPPTDGGPPAPATLTLLRASKPGVALADQPADGAPEPLLHLPAMAVAVIGPET